MRHKPSHQSNQPVTQAKRWLHTRKFTVIVLLVLAVVLVSFGKELIRKIEIQRQIASLQEQIDEQEQRNQELNDMVAYFNSSSFQDKQARQKLNVKAPGETVVMIPDDSTTAATGVDADNDAATAAAEPNYKKWEHYFLND